MSVSRAFVKDGRVAGESVAEQVQGRILDRILSGVYAPLTRLPPERELALEFAVSRVSVREALQNLVQSKMIEVRQGSGAQVRPRREWTVDVLPAYLRHELAAGNLAAAAAFFEDLLTLRRTILVSTISVRGSKNLDVARLEAARVAVRKSWEAREDLGTYLTWELEMIRSLLEAGGSLAGIWILNKLSEIYTALAASVPVHIAPPEDHLESKLGFIDALAAGDMQKARGIIERHLDSHDRAVLRLFGRESSLSAHPAPKS